MNNEERILEEIIQNKELMLDSIKKVVQHKSVYDAKTVNEKYPYGKNINDCLEYVLELGKNLGFEIENVNNQFGIIKYNPQKLVTKDYIGIVGHLDVVPEGDGWNFPPFGAVEDNNKIYGRGILDNKGPIITCLFALYAIKELNIELDYPIWIMFGTNEETGFNDVVELLKHKNPPLMGFTPDCKYPVVYAERGRCEYNIKTKIENIKIFNQFINEYFLSSDSHANKLGLNIKDPEFGMMELRNQKLIGNEENLIFSFSLSYPKSITNEEIKKQIISKMPDCLELKLVKNYDPVFFEKDGILCKKLQKAYEKITNNDGTPVTTTGGTYAKMIPNIVPFGPSFPEQKGIAHNPDEWMDINDIMTNTKIYGLAIYYLGSKND